MNGTRSILEEVCCDVLVDAFGNEWYKWSGNLAKCIKSCVQSHVRRLLVRCPLATPVTFTATANIPVGKHIGKLFNSASSFGNFVVSKALVHSFYKLVNFRKQPLVHQSEFAIGKVVLAWIKVVDVGIQNVERIGVPQSTKELALSFAYGIVVETAWEPWRTCCVEVPTYRICTLLVEAIPWVNNVALVLGHLYAVLVAYKAKYDAVFEGRFAKQQCGNCQKCVEPTTSLVNGLADEICREVAFKQILVFEWVMELCIRHATAIKPAVDNLRCALERATAVASPLAIVDKWTVKFDVFVTTAKVR